VSSGNRIHLTLCALLLLFAGQSGAVSYIGVGAGPSFHEGIGSEQYVFDFEAETIDSFAGSFGTGWGIEAQFGWEVAPWVDVEGAMRYNRFSRSDTVTTRSYVKGYDVIGFEGGIRLHLRRHITNSTPYIRGGVGSYSSTSILEPGGDLSIDPVLGYYVGVGYMHEITGSVGFDIRATALFFDAKTFQYDTGVRLRGEFYSLVLSIIAF
jgi:hypothetical protein